MQHWAEFIGKPGKALSRRSKGLLEGTEVRVVKDRGVLHTCGAAREDGNWLQLEEAAYLVQRQQLHIQGTPLETLFSLLDKRIPDFALYSYLRRSGLIPRPAVEGFEVYAASGFVKRLPGPKLYTVVPVEPKDTVEPREEVRVAVVEQGRVLRLVEFARWQGS